MTTEGTLSIVAICAFVAIYFYGRKSRDVYIDSLKLDLKDGESYRARQSLAINQLTSEIKTQQTFNAKQIADVAQKNTKQLIEAENRERILADKNKELKDFYTATLEKLKEEGASLPSAVRWAIKLKEGLDQIIINRLELPPHPAPAAASQVKEARSLLRKSESEAELLRNRIDLYEAQAPWLIEYQNYSLDEILSGLKEEQETRQCYESGGDPVELFVPRMEWTNLTETERNQKALDRYWEPSRTRSAWTAGIQYERYVGYLYETDGYIVTYHGAVEGKEDLGIDLICMKNDIVHLIQCKRLSVVKGNPVRENVVAQIYGAAMFYAMRSGINPKNAKAVIVTTYELSEQALQFAKLLNVSVQERRSFEPYPCIKCNISSADQERIYHLPFDQQYDLTVIEKDKGEFYALTVADAVRAGFRRAYRWRGQT